MSADTEIEGRDARELSGLQPPSQRAAYSDRMAWQMAVLAELAYIRFESQPIELLKELAIELAKATDAGDVTELLLQAYIVFQTGSPDGEERLRSVLKVGGFELIGTFFNKSLDPLKNTEGYVAKRVVSGSRGYMVLAIRGTTSPQDWIKNAKVRMLSIGGGRQVHTGFHEAFHDARAQIDTLLREHLDLPLYVTGHSLGGAVAVMATWEFQRDQLAACYTFGAPRVGNHAFNDGFHTPIYRVVNSFDPVPLVPPSGKTVSFLKFVSNLIGKLGFAFFTDFVGGWLKKIQGYRHAGDLRYMTAGEMDAEGRYPTVKYYTHFGLIDRIVRLWNLIKTRQLKRLDIYHRMPTYRRKLRHRALDRRPRTEPEV